MKQKISSNSDIDCSIEFRNDLESNFYEWLKEAEALNLVKDCLYEPYSIEITPQVYTQFPVQYPRKGLVIEKRELHSAMSYTPDFQFYINREFLKSLKHLLFSSKGHDALNEENTDEWILVIVDIKSAFGNRFKNNVSADTFPIKAKAIYALHGIYINKLVPINLYKRTWAPDIEMYKLNGKLRNTKTSRKCITRKEYLKRNKKWKNIVHNAK